MILASTIYRWLRFVNSGLVPRTNAVPRKEIEICRRLRDARKSTNLSQVAFANIVGIDSSRLASYEHGRVPLRYEFARTVCKRFSISQRWLATGNGNPHPFIEVSPEVEQGINLRGLFSKAYEDCLRKPIERLHGEMERVFKTDLTKPIDEAVLKKFPPAGTPYPESMKFYMDQHLEKRWERLFNPDLKHEFFTALHEASVEFFTRNDKRIAAARLKHLETKPKSEK